MRGRPRRLRHAAPPPSRAPIYSEPYECAPPAPAASRRAALRRLLARRPRAARPARPAAARLLPAAGAGALATVVYSDRYFRYGLPLRSAPAATQHHHAPLRPACPLPAPTQRAGVLLEAATTTPLSSPRYAVLRRARRDLPRVFEAGEAALGAYPARRLPPDYRQAASVALRPELWQREWAPREAGGRDSEQAEYNEPPSPEFARADTVTDAEAEADAEAESSRSASAASEVQEAMASTGALKDLHVTMVNETRAAPDKAVAEVAVAARKVLNMERYNKGARAVRVRGGRRGGSRAQRAAVRALLALSGAFYAVALLAFYFLSLA